MAADPSAPSGDGPSVAAYRTLFAANPLPMWVFDTDTLAFLDVNDAAVARYGYSRDEFLGMTIQDIRPPQDQPALLETLHGSGTLDRSGPWRHLAQDGTVIEVEITSHVVDFGEHRGRFVMAEDVTQRERTQRHLQQAQRMESLGELAGGIAHDFNNALAVMLAYTSFATQALTKAVDEDADRWAPVLHDVEQIGIAGRRAAGLTQQLLAFASGDSADAGPLDVNDVLRGLEDMLRRTLGERVDLELLLETDLSAIVGNAGQLEQVIVNLAVNARDAMPSGGRLLIETSTVDVDDGHAVTHPELPPGRYVRLRVSDTGTGMDAAARDHAFEPFFTTKQRGSGTGLGLATVYGIVTRAGGTIHIYSEPGLGTSITVLFPATDVPAWVDVPAPAVSSEQGDATVLVVEDDDQLRAVTERILTTRGYRVLSASDGSGALEIAAAHPGAIDIMLTDIVMPEMLGSELAVQLHETDPEIRVLYMSGYVPPLLRSGGTLPHGAPLIDKPFSADRLSEKIREVLGASG